MKSTFVKLFAALFAMALIAGACGSSSSGSDGEAAASLEAAQNRAAAAEAEAADAKAEAEAAKAAQEKAEADADAAMSAADDEPAEAMGEFEGKIVRITGPERSVEEWGAMQAALDAFGEENGMTIIYTGSADWEAEINVQLAANNPPDISIFPQPGKLADFARDDLVLEIPADVVTNVSKNWNDAAMGFGLVDGAQFGVPNKNDLKSLVWYKPARFAEAGYEVPETWDELLALTDTMIADGNTPWCVGIESGQATGWTFTDWTEDLMLRIHGPEDYDAWVANELKFSDPKVISVFDEILSLWNTPDAVFASGGSISSTHFANGPGEGLAADDCAMVRQASFFSGFLPEGSSSDIDVFYFPSVDENKPVLGAGTLAGAFQDRPEVWAVMEYYGSPEYANARQAAQKEAKGGSGQLSGFNTANLNADKSLWEPLEQSFLDIMQNAAVFRFDGSDLMPADVGAGTFWSEGTAMVNGEKSTTAAAAAIDASWPEDS